MMCGGTGGARDVSDDEKQIFLALKSTAETKAAKTFAVFEPVSVKSQVVAGTNFFVKIKVDDNDYVHMRVYRPLPGQGDPQLHGLQVNKKVDEVLEYFDQQD